MKEGLLNADFNPNHSPEVIVENNTVRDAQYAFFLLFFEILDTCRLNCSDCSERKKIGLDSPCMMCGLMLADLTHALAEATLK